MDRKEEVKLTSNGNGFGLATDVAKEPTEVRTTHEKTAERSDAKTGAKIATKKTSRAWAGF